ncbi:hypothetical protein PM082_019842 [Marasmius tenuissimus]|nr:hypothetical protein PM082_019842 [Marasmius tenuissimus]
MCQRFQCASEDILNGRLPADAADLKSIDVMHRELDRRPFDLNLTTQVANATSNLSGLTRTVDATSIQVDLLRCYILDSYRMIYNWVDSLVMAACKEPDSWYGKLHSVCRCITTNTFRCNELEFTLSSEPYLPLVPPRVYAVHRNKRSISATTLSGRSSTDVNHLASKLMTRIVIQWFGLPPNDELLSKKMILQTIWQTFSHPAIFVLEPIYRVIHGNLKELQRSTRRQSGKSWTITNLKNIVSNVKSVASNYGEAYTAHLDALHHARTSYTNTLNTPRSFSDPTGNTIQTKQPPSANRLTLDDFVEWLRACAVLLTSDGTGLSWLMEKIYDDTDAYFPLREYGCSRAWITAEDGPYKADVISTRIGLFCALVFHGVTFRTPAVTEHSGRFQGLDGWNTFKVQHCDRPESWFCNVSAYGTSKGRSTGHVKGLWDFSQVFMNFLEQDPKLSFCAVVAKLMTLPSWGILTAYLCAVDLVYAGVVEASEDDVAWFVEEAGLGAQNGLRKLGLDGSPASFRHAFAYVNARLTAEEKTVMGWNHFVMEHSLCKFSKLYGLILRWGL